jgi:CRISPR type IV-associated protein Csf3
MSFFKPELFCEYERRIADLPQQAFTVSIETLFPVYHTDPLTLDGLLAWCVVWKLFEGKPPGYGGDAWWIPLPLKELARHKELPLWAATDFRAINPHHDCTNYHRRSGDNPYSGFALKETSNTRRPRRIPSSVNGQYMDYRIPEQLEIADRWDAEGIGNINEVSHLLKLVQNLGRGGSRGRGRIRKIEIRALEDFSLVTPEGRLKKNVPIEIDIGLNHNKDRIQFAGWTPAYWQQKNWEYCYLA